MWERLQEDEHDEMPRKWKNPESGETVKIERFENGTWDTFHGETLIENFDEKTEAIERGREIID